MPAGLLSALQLCWRRYDAHWQDPLAGKCTRNLCCTQCASAAPAAAPESLLAFPCTWALPADMPTQACCHTWPPHAPSTPLAAADLQFRSSTYHALGARLKRLADELCGGRLVFMLEVDTCSLRYFDVACAS